MEQEEIYTTLEKAYFSDVPDEEAVLKHLPRWLGGCKHFVDIGASIGQYTYNANRIMCNGRIDAFEADPIRVTKLKENCTRWALTNGNTITAQHAAVARGNGTVTFYSTQSNISGGLFPNDLNHLDDKTRAEVKWEKIYVPAVSLDALYSSPPQFIKMDIEGAEGDALQGAVRLLRLRQTQWLIELHGFEGGWQPRQVVDFMRSYRYRAEEIAPSRFLFTPLSIAAFLKQELKSAARRTYRYVKYFKSLRPNSP